MLRTTIAICLLSLVLGSEYNVTLENDIIRSSFEHSGRFARQAEVKKVWTNALLPISFNSAYPASQRASAVAGMKIWEANSCVRFRQNDVTSSNRIEIVDGGSCQSNVGIHGGRQTVILGRDCNGISTTAHELGHAMGLQHMQTRSDRDTYITLQRSNIDATMFDLNFKIENTASTMGVPYDITSIMHYQPYDFALNKALPACVPKSMFSEYTKMHGQLLALNLRLPPQKCASYRTVCSNNGVMDVNNCNQCLCPSGWGGRTCTENPTGTEVKTATVNWQQISTTLGNPNDQLVDFKFKHFVINETMFDLNFKIEPTASTMGVPYDITSIMHYLPYEVNQLYKCDQKSASYRTVCSNNGVMDVNNCNQCLCPPGWGGKACTENPTGTCEVKTATANWQQISTTLGNPNDHPNDEFNFKHFVINAPANRKVEVKIEYMWASDSPGCKFGGMEIFEKVDTRITPPRICKMADTKTVYRSPNTRMYIRLYNRIYQLTANMSYRFV